MLEAGGIGWSLSVTPATMAALPSAGGECQIYLVHIQREDAQELYGFHSRFERGVFRRLMTVSGIGPKQSLRILSGLEAAVLVRAIAGGDVRLLSSVPGLGKKTAEKLVFELQDKLDDLATGEMGPEADSVPGQTAAPESSAAADANAALLSLGFSRWRPGRGSGCPEGERRGRIRPGTDYQGPAPCLSPSISRTGKPEPDLALRPHSLGEFVGQEQLVSHLAVYVGAARARGEALDHVLFYGPPGLGKTTLSRIMAEEMGVNIVMTTAPALERAGDLASILTGLEQRDVLFIDEIHRLRAAIEETLYSAMEDFAIDIVIGQGAGARTVRLPLPRFTLIGATTRTGCSQPPSWPALGSSTASSTTVRLRSGGSSGVTRHSWIWPSTMRGSRFSPPGCGARRGSAIPCCAACGIFCRSAGKV